MRRSRLIAMLTAALLLGSAPSVHAAYTLAQLQVIEALILDGNLSGLRLFLQNNPGILEGDDPLAAELRGFMQEQQSALSDFAFSEDDDDDQGSAFPAPGSDPY